MPADPIILASTSPYRKQLLERIGIPFEAKAPLCDEEAVKDQLADQALTADQLACALAQAKAKSLAEREPNAIIIGSDQVAQLDGKALGKPGTEERALAQLSSMNGRSHQLCTAVCIIANGKYYEHLDVTTLHMAQHNEDALIRYVQRDQALDCAGSYKLEAAGISLFERIESDDHSAITGLPLLFVCNCLRTLGIAIP